MTETWVVVEGLTGCRDRDNPDPAQRCECHGFGIETTDAIPRIVCWANEEGVTPGIHLRADAEAIASAHNETPALKADNARLRALVKAAEANGQSQHPLEQPRVNCPWCQYDTTAGKKRHAPDCPAFTPDGQVR